MCSDTELRKCNWPDIGFSLYHRNINSPMLWALNFSLSFEKHNTIVTSPNKARCVKTHKHIDILLLQIVLPIPPIIQMFFHGFLKARS